MAEVKWVIYHIDTEQYDNIILVDDIAKFTYWAGREVEQYPTREELMANITSGVWQDHPEFSPLGVAAVCPVSGLVWIVFPVDKPAE